MLCAGLVIVFVAGAVPVQARVANDTGARSSSRPAIVVSIDSPQAGQTFQVTSRLGVRTVRPARLQKRVDGRWAKVRTSSELHWPIWTNALGGTFSRGSPQSQPRYFRSVSQRP